LLLLCRHVDDLGLLVAFGGYNGKYHNTVSVYKLPLQEDSSEFTEAAGAPAAAAAGAPTATPQAAAAGAAAKPSTPKAAAGAAVAGGSPKVNGSPAQQQPAASGLSKSSSAQVRVVVGWAAQGFRHTATHCRPQRPVLTCEYVPVIRNSCKWMSLHAQALAAHDSQACHVGVAASAILV
jgi:hypothetical protein